MIYKVGKYIVYYPTKPKLNRYSYLSCNDFFVFYLGKYKINNFDISKGIFIFDDKSVVKFLKNPLKYLLK